MAGVWPTGQFSPVGDKLASNQGTENNPLSIQIFLGKGGGGGERAEYLAVETGGRPLIQLGNRAKELWRGDSVRGKECHKIGFSDWWSSR